jgi:hypothetical protein
MPTVVGEGLVGDLPAQPVEEVLDCRLGHPVQQDLVGGPPDGTQGWPVAGADGELGPVLSECAQLDVGVQPGKQPPSPTGSQVRGNSTK